MRTILIVTGFFFALVSAAFADARATPPPAPPPHGDQLGLQMFVLPSSGPRMGFGQNISVFQIPAHGLTFTKFVADRAGTLAEVGTVITSHAEKLCDGKLDGWYIDYKVALGPTPAEVEQTIVADAAAFYMASYSRAANQPENADGRKALDTLCVATAPQ